jgi:hypothetical protein
LAEILKTWPSSMPRKRVLAAFSHFSTFYFSIGRGKPQRSIERLWYTHKGVIIGCFRVGVLKQNDGSFPKLRSITGDVSEWQIKRDMWTAICPGPFERLKERVYHSGFRGWRYFDLEQYKKLPESRIRF